jgi:hypothetical protein
MSSQAIRLPKQFPVGTRYVIEGRGGHIQSRYLEFPDGRHVELPAQLAERSRAPLAGARRHRSRRRAAEKS